MVFSHSKPVNADILFSCRKQKLYRSIYLYDPIKIKALKE